MEILCIIPARGGSKGIPRKNIREIAGRPLIAWAIEAAHGSRAINRVVVSTDDKEIGDIAVRHGAEVVIRPAEISGDSSSSESALLHALEFLDSEEGYKPDLLVFMQCTSPLTLSEDLDGAMDVFLQTGSDVVFSVVRTHAFLWRIGTDGFAEEINHDRHHRPMRQEMEAQFQETGAFYLLDAEKFRKKSKRFFGRVMPYELPIERVVDIDVQADLKFAEHFLFDRISPDVREEQ
jgi:CMP-N-acetylneuraminic acid synthetase